jgi:hypothetical protein
MRAELERLVAALCKAGYEKHGGLRIMRRGEMLALRKGYLRDGLLTDGLKNQCHVQIVAMADETVAVFAHVEPYGYGLRHFISAVCDRANYGAGASMLRRDLKRAGLVATMFAPVNKGKS